MKFVTALALATGMFTLASAQVYPVINPDDVSNSTRDIWCEQQIGICPNLCQDQAHVDPIHNDCWPEDLYYVCICEGNITPNLSEYSLTVPYNLCMQSKQACANNCGNNQDCANLCFSGKQCGASGARRVNTTSTATESATSTTTSTATNTDSSSTSTSTSKDPFSDSGMGVSLIAFGSAYGVAAMIACMAIGFFGVL